MTAKKIKKTQEALIQIVLEYCEEGNHSIVKNSTILEALKTVIEALEP